MRKDLGEKVDSSDIKKHKKDVLRIASELMLEKVEELPIAVNTDIHSLINLLEQEPFDQNSLKRYMLKNEDVVELLKKSIRIEPVTLRIFCNLYQWIIWLYTSRIFLVYRFKHNNFTHEI